MATNGQTTDSDERLGAVLLEYEEAVERGEAPDRGRLLADHPEFARELAEFFATRDQVDRLAAPLRAAGEADGSGGDGADSDATIPHDPRGTAGRARRPVLRRIGDYRIVREVGRGGMGVVYEAEQISLRRRVALKVLPFAAAVDPRHLQRFHNEAQAAAQLHHTHIVPVFAVGAENGVHYYAMQFIDGPSLAQVLSDLRDNRQGSGEQSSTTPPPFTPLRLTEPSVVMTAEHATRRRDYYRRVAELGWQAADAIEYAHQIGVVHRDVKPANLLLDPTGRLWVADFGLAQIRNDTGLTATGEVVGTLRYMSPEQASGRPGLVDHRTDIYSLGATLYELLTLTPVFPGDDRRELAHQVADDEPRAPRAIDHTVPAELETIVLKALAKTPADRYPSARELADGLRRFLDDRPILARRPTVVDQAAKWVRRHRRAALAGAAGLVLAAVGLAVSTAVIAVEHERTKTAYDRERQANDRERVRAAEAEDNYRRTRRAVDLFVELSDEELLDFPPLAPLRQRLLEAAVAYYLEMSDRREDPAVREDLAASRERLRRFRDELAAFTVVNRVLLLDQPVVRTDLGLTPDQTERLAPLLARVKAQRHAPAQTGDRRQSLAGLAAECRREVEQVLTAAQDRRLRQVNLQLPGPHAFDTPVLDELGLSPDQRTQVRRVQSEATQVSLRIVATAGTRAESGAKFAEVWEGANARIRELFAAEQKARWAEMIGLPVQGTVRFPPPMTATSVP
ncbi:serine/threonine protein kinase [bacterium]|nr:serine/threonine protein kinase [bacterium]